MKILSTVSLLRFKDLWILDVDGVRLMIGSALGATKSWTSPKRQ